MPNTPYGKQNENSQKEQSQARSHMCAIVAPAVFNHTITSDMSQAGRTQAVAWKNMRPENKFDLPQSSPYRLLPS